MTTEYWPDSVYPIMDGATWLDSAAMRTWTAHGTELTLYEVGVGDLRVEIANTIANLVTDTFGVSVQPFPIDVASVPQVSVEPADPYIEPATFGPGSLMWHFNIRIVVSRASTQFGLDWMERVTEQIIAATLLIPGATFEQLSQPQTDEIADTQYLTALASVTVTRERT